jgi:hypothetical protein
VVTQNSARVVNVRAIALAFAALVLLMAGLLAMNWISATSSSRSATPTLVLPAGNSSGPTHGRARPQNLAPAKPQHYS